MIKKLMIGTGLAALAAGAIAAPAMMDDGEMTRDEVVAKVREHFTRMDTNKDGAIAEDEMAAMREHHMAKMGRMGEGHDGHDLKMPDANEAFDRIDANKDGSISRDEFAAGRQMRIEKRIVMHGGPDGAGEPGEMRKMKMRHGGRGGHMQMMAMADVNKDGKVTLAEAEGMALQHFDEMDANKDGKVTREERQKAWQAKRDQQARQKPTAG